MATDAKILKVLALNEAFAQYDLPKRVDRIYRQVIRCLHNLRDKHLIYLKRTEQSAKGGKERNIWAITFYGLMEILKYLDNREIDRVAQKHGDKWLVFAEWTYFAGKGAEAIYLLVKQISFWDFSSLQTGVPQPLREEEKQARAKLMGYSTKEYEKHRNQMRLFLLEKQKHECTDVVLGLGSVFGREKSALSRFVLEKRPEEKRMLLKVASRQMKRFIDNPQIREYIDKRFKQEDALHELYVEIRGQWEKVIKTQMHTQ